MGNRTFSFTRNLLTTSWMIHPEVAMAMYPMLAGALAGAQFEETPLESYRLISADGFSDIQSSGNRQLIAVNRISGTMFKHDSCCEKGTRTIAGEMTEADSNPYVIGHILIIESGGGASNSVPELADAMDTLTKPVVAYIDGMACSAAQWAAALCDWTIASRPDDQVGCIGTYVEFHAYRRSGAQNEHGQDVVRIYADGSDRKNEEFEEALQGNLKLIKEKVLNPANEVFKEDMRRRRPAVTDEILRGATYKASDVLGILVDEIGPMDLAIAKVKALAKERGIMSSENDNSQSQSYMEEYPNITSVSGLEDLEMQADGMVTLNREQLAAINAALEDGVHAEELQTQVSTLEAENSTLRTDIAARDARIAELERSIDDGAASSALNLEGPALTVEKTPADAARAYMEEYNKRNSI